MNPGVFIKGTGVISPQKTFENEVFDDGFTNQSGNRKQCIEPDYSKYIDPKQIRRMSRIIRMSVTSSIAALKNAEIEKPDAVIVGTAFGCLDDTYAFLSKLVQFKEDMLSPTAFIHSTHNTIAAQIALHYKCYGYNSTYVHRSTSFESALADAVMMLEAKEVQNVLVGGADEIIDAGFTIMNRMGLFKDEDVSNNLYTSETKGVIAGEGAAFFSLVQENSSSCIAKISAVASWSNVSSGQALEKIKLLLERHRISSPDILITGLNGDLSSDNFSKEIISSFSPSSKLINYKHLCGEYGTSSAFATWLGANMLKKQIIPQASGFENNSGAAFKNILIYNQYNKVHHSAILLEAC